MKKKREREKRNKMPKKAVASKRSRGLSSSKFDTKRFISAEVKARFIDLVTRRLGLKERGFDLDVENYRVEYSLRVIESRVGRFFASTERPPP